MKGFILGILATLIALLVGGRFVLTSGYVNFSADQRPSSTEMHLAMSAMDAWAEHNAPDVKNPVPATEENLVTGAKLYLEHCAGCHGLPSNPNSQFAKSFNPPVPNFFRKAPDMPENQNFFITKQGIRWTGMPAWSHILSDTQIWQTVTFMSNIEKLPPAAQKVLEPQEAAAPPPPPMPKGMR
jgi:mono/diheme cytochrome c family protein